MLCRKKLVWPYLVFLLFGCSTEDSHDASATKQVETEAFVEEVRSVLPTPSEYDLRANQCAFYSWTRPGIQSCVCKLSVQIACSVNGRAANETLSSEGEAERMLFAAVCSRANEAAGAALIRKARERANACAGSGGTMTKDGDVQFARGD